MPKLNLDDRTVIFQDDGRKEVTLHQLLESDRATVVFVEAFRRYLAVMHNGNMLTGLETTKAVFEEYSDERTPYATWKIVVAIACATLISQIAVYFVANWIGAHSLWWRPLLSTLIATVILSLV